MSNLFWVMFWKGVVLTLWAIGEDALEARKKRKAEQSERDALLLAFQQEWDRRRAKQPLILIDGRASRFHFRTPPEE